VLLQSWADDPNEDVRRAAQDALESYRRLDEEASRRMQQYADLLSGKVTPDDLLAPATAWVWDGADYVPEQ
jgi:hypothetical protein